MAAKHTTGNKSKRKNRIPRPFLKWVGGKAQILGELRKSCPSEFGKYHEPFIGGGAMFFDIQTNSASLSDANEELINCYQVVRDRVEDLIVSLQQHVYDKEHYYRVRDWNPEELDPVDRAARTIYLNQCGFNGLYRVNSKGKFNVPFGRHSNPTICDRDNLRGCSATLRGVEISSASFESILDKAVAGDFVYFDPPYIPLSETASFTAYQKHGFGMDNQELLAQVFDELAARGVHALLSNADVPWIRKRYRSHRIRSVQALRHVNSNASRRGPVGEVIVVSKNGR